jgi:probable HAF family extracellular repeat protein
MKSTTSMCMVGMTLFAALAAQMSAQDQAEQDKNQLNYSVTNLGTLGGTQSSAYGINDRGWVAGAANLEGDQTEHAVLWRDGLTVDLGTLGGPNGSAGNPLKNNLGLIPAFAQTSEPDPLGENWNFTCTLSGNLCQGTDLIQHGFLWVDGRKVPMPTLGGNNGAAWGANDRGQVVGLAETDTVDPNCVAPQILDVEAVLWTPINNRIQELPPYPGDSVGAAVGINDSGQAVGATGSCGPVSPALGAHAVLWENGQVKNLGSLGGALSNVAYAINNRGQVVGLSDLSGDTTAHAFLWQNGTMTDLGTLPGDFFSAAFSINNKAQVAGESCDVNFDCRAFLWQKGTMTDLNTLIPPNSSLYLLSANDLNDRGEIVGEAFDQSTGDVPAFLAIPCDHGNDCEANSSAEQKIILPENVREKLLQRRGLGRFAAGLTRPQ